ncbi:MAG TPA: hypothetical protein VFU31_21225 [Candidatus Binatia bacterium]|nr:hypothetical protein [Candidatus Binatia bacterium]
MSTTAFHRWMNRPVARVHVYTWSLANELEANCPVIRLLRLYRHERTNKFRWRLAQWLKCRRVAGKIELPTYNEKEGRYEHVF